VPGIVVLIWEKKTNQSNPPTNHPNKKNKPYPFVSYFVSTPYSWNERLNENVLVTSLMQILG